MNAINPPDDSAQQPTGRSYFANTSEALAALEISAEQEAADAAAALEALEAKASGGGGGGGGAAEEGLDVDDALFGEEDEDFGDLDSDEDAEEGEDED